MLQMVICDDELLLVELIAEKLEAVMRPLGEYQCFKTTNPEEVVALSGEVSIDLLLIDIDMPGINGFETIRRIKLQNDKTMVIFITNMDLLVYESLKYRPFRFIRKSHLEELNEAVLSAVFLLETQTAEFTVPISSVQSVKVKTRDIIYFESLHNNVRLVMKDREYTYRSTLKVIEKELEGAGFVRIHNGYLLNVKYVHLIRRAEVEVSVCDNRVLLPISR